MPGRTKQRSDAAEEISSVTADTAMEDVVPPSAQRPLSSQENGDAEMQDEQQAEAGDRPVDEEESQRVRILPGSSETAASFEFLKEGHTLGNALRYIIMTNPNVEFCAYSIPHPSEDKMNLRIQTYDTTTASAALGKGLDDLQDLCDIVADEFWTERDKFMGTQTVV